MPVAEDVSGPATPPPTSQSSLPPAPSEPRRRAPSKT